MRRLWWLPLLFLLLAAAPRAHAWEGGGLHDDCPNGTLTPNLGLCLRHPPDQWRRADFKDIINELDTLSTGGGGGGASRPDTQIVLGTGASITSSSDYTYDYSNKILNIN